MSSVWYIGTKDQRIITRAEWRVAGVAAIEDNSWSFANGWSIPTTLFSADQLAILAQDKEFQLNAPDGRRPGSPPLTPENAPPLAQKDLDAALTRIRVFANTLMGIGDSLMAENHDLNASPVTLTRRSWVDIGNMLGGSRFDFMGDAATGGMNTQQIIDAHLPTVLAAKPRYCLVNVGNNNIDALTDNDLVNIRTVYTRMLDAGVTPIAVIPFPVRTSENYFRFKRYIQALAYRLGIPSFDATPALADSSTGVLPVAWSDDGTHLNVLGVNVLAKAFGDWCKTFLPSTVEPAYLLPYWMSDAGPNPFLLTDVAGSTLPAYYGEASAAANRSLTPLKFGNRFAFTKGTIKSQYNTPTYPVKASTEYALVCRMGATVEAQSGSWSLLGLDSTTYATVFQWDQIRCDVPQDTLLVTRFRTSPTTTGIIMAMTLTGAEIGAESGSAGTVFNMSQLGLRELVAV